MDIADLRYIAYRWLTILEVYSSPTNRSLLDYRINVAIDLLQALDPVIGKTSFQLASDTGVDRSILKSILDSDFAEIPRINRLYFRP